MSNGGFKVRDVGTDSGPQWKRYAALMVGKDSFWELLKYELIIFVCGGLGGAVGLLLRKKLYPYLLGKSGKNLVIGKNVTLRHAHKIHLGDNIIIDDNCVLDAKGGANKGIFIGNNVFVGRNTIIYTKDGDIYIGDAVNISVNCDIYSKQRVEIGKNTMIAAYTYIMCGGQYNYHNREPFAQQSSQSKGPTIIGESCWLGTKAVVTDNVKIGSGAVIGAGAIVNSDIPTNVIAVGTPARISKNRFDD
jgi:acetyltransferase-like isoleucine patch superfamily enzyme